MKIIVDTNVIIDILLKREPFFASSYGALRHAIERGAICLVSASAMSDVFYLLGKTIKDTAKVIECLESLFRLVSVVDVLGSDIYASISTGFTDFEDAIIFLVALREQADLILTRNAKDFVFSTIPVQDPASYLAATS